MILSFSFSNHCTMVSDFLLSLIFLYESNIKKYFEGLKDISLKILQNLKIKLFFETKEFF